MKTNFIKTKKKETAEKLEKLGFTFLFENNGEYTFANDGVTTFDKNDEVEFTNVLYG